MQARDIMTREVICISPGASVHEAARRLAANAISGMPVLGEDGGLVGMVTEADLLAKEGAIVAEIMSRRVLSVTEETPVDHIAQLLTSNRYKRVPVVRGERVVGIVSRGNIIRMMASRWVCPICGAVQLGGLPEECVSCGAQGSRFERELEPRPEISTRQ